MPYKCIVCLEAITAQEKQWGFEIRSLVWIHYLCLERLYESYLCVKNENEEEMKPLTPEYLEELSKTRNGFYSWDYVAGLAARVIELEASQMQEYQVPPESFNDLMEFIMQGTKDSTIIIKNLTTTNAGLKQKRIEELEQRVQELEETLDMVLSERNHAYDELGWAREHSIEEYTTIPRLKAENERLREALDEIVTKFKYAGSSIFAFTIDDLVCIAQKALKDGE